MDEFGNFISGENMIWEASSLHPVLVSPNRVIKRQRYLVNNLTGNEEDVNLDEYIYYYEDKIDGEYDYYGSYTNPIVISNGIQFVQMSATERLTPYTDTSSGINETIYTSLNQNDYIVIKDIDLSSVIDLGLENLQSITYAGMFEGNGFTFDNVSILSEKSSHLSGVSFGMFEQIGALVLFENDVLVTVDVTDYHAQFKNLTIKINAISGTHATAVGTLAGVIVNADIINVNLLSNSTEKVTVQGERYVGALAGYVAGDSVITNITSDISVSADFRNSGSDISKIKPYIMGNIGLNNSIFAYKFEIDTHDYTGGFAGGIIGLADCFTLKITKSADTAYASVSRYDFDKTGYNYIAVNFAPQILSITVKDNVSIMGDIAGGLIGINYSGTSIYNGRFILTLGDEQKISGGIISGGLIGQNYGKIDQSAITHDDETQTQIDEGSITSDQINQTLFYESNKEPVYVGGLVGYNNGVGSNSGIITNCYSRAEVLSKNAYNVGGMVGYMASGYLQYCYVSGNVVCRQQTEDPDTGNVVGSDGRAAGAVAYLASFTSKNSIKYFTEYTGLGYYSMWGLVVANNWDNNVNINTTGALLGFASSNIRLTEGLINGDMDIYVNNMDGRLYDALYLYSESGPYNIVKVETNGALSTTRLLESFTFAQYKAYAEEDANPGANKLYQLWDTSIWDLQAPYFPLLRLNANGNQTYITNEDELRAIGTKGYYIVQNDIYLTKDWIPVDGFEGTLTSKKKKDGTYCTIYNVNINGECYGKISDSEDENDTIENMGNIGFFSSIKDKAYIYNLNFVIGGNVMLPDDYDELSDGTPVHVQRTEWENFEGKTAYTAESGREADSEIPYSEAFINGITNYLDYMQIIKNNAADLAAGLFTNSYGTGALAGVATNATISNITVSYSEYTTYEGLSPVTKRASMNANTPYIGGFIGYAQNTKLTNCQVTQNPVKHYIKNNVGENIPVEAAATINVYNNEYDYSPTTESMKFANFQSPLEIAKIIVEFYQQPQCVGGFIGKLDAKSSYIKFNGRNVEAHINIYERYANKDTHRLPALNLNVGGLIGYANVASLDTVNVYATIESAVNTVGIDLSGISGLENVATNKTELNIGGVIGVSDKSIYNYCIFAGTIKLCTASQSFTQPPVKSISTVNIGGVIGKIQSDVTTNYCIARGYDKFTEVSGYSKYVDPIIIDGADVINYLYIGGTIGNAITVSPKIKKSLFTGLISLNGNVDELYVGGVLGHMFSSNSLTNQATIQMSYTTGTIDLKTKVSKQVFIGGIAGRVYKISASNIASTMNIINLGSSLSQTAVCYVGNFAGILGESGNNNASVNDCFTAGAIKIDKENLRGAIGGFVGAMYGTVKNTYTATTITSISDDRAVDVTCTENEKRYLSTDGIIGPMFGYSSTILQSASTITAFYVFDYTGCVMRTVEADASRYGKQIAVSDISKECIYGTNDPVMSVFAGSNTGSWKTLTYGEYIYSARNAYSLPILSFLEADTTLNAYCKFSETMSNTKINILSNPGEDGVAQNTHAQEYQLYYGSKLYPYLLKNNEGYDLERFRDFVENQKIDVTNSYFALANDFVLDIPELVAFDNINFNLLGHGNAINVINGRLFTNHLSEGNLIASVDFKSDYSIIGTNDGIIYNTLVSGSQNIPLVGGYISAFIKENNGLVVNSGVSATITINGFSENARYGMFAARNNATGIINSCFTTGKILLTAEAADQEGKVAGFISTVAEGSHIMNIISAATFNYIGLDKLKYTPDIKAFVTTFESSEVILSRVFVDQLTTGYENAYDFEVNKGNKEQVRKNVYLVNTSYLINYSDEGDKVSGDDTLGIMYGSKAYSDSDISLKYALAGRNYNYDYFMAYNYGYPFPALIAYYEGRSIKESLFTGNGSELTPYQIPHAGKVDWIRKMLENTNETFFVLNSDIYMNVFNSFEPILSNKTEWFSTSQTDYEKNTFDYQRNLCYSSAPSAKPFTLNGLMNKTQYIIYYLTQDLDKTDAGLFASLTGGQKIINVAMTYANIRTTGAKSGVVAGTLRLNAKLENVGVFNSFIYVPTNVNSKADIGGLVGYVENVDTLSKVSAEVKINMPANKNEINVGGLIGQAYNMRNLTYSYSGSNINVLDNEKVPSISKTNIGGLVGYNFNEINGGTTFDNCVILTSVNYSGLVGYQYNLKNYGKETLLDSEELNNSDKITAFANIGNVVGASHVNEDTELVDHVTIKNTYFCDQITMITQTYAVGNNYGVDNTGLIIARFNNCLTVMSGKKYCAIGAKIGSKIVPINIDGEETTLEDFGAANEYALFGMLIASHEVPSDGIDLNGKFLYGNGVNSTITVNGSMINEAINCLFSNIIVEGIAKGENRGGTGLLCNYAENVLVFKCSSNGNVESSGMFVGGLVGYGEGTVLNQCVSQSVVNGDFAEAKIGSVAGQIHRGGLWFCSANNPTLISTGNGAQVGGLIGYVSEDNSFVINCSINTGRINASLNGGTAGGIVGHLDGLIVKGNVGTTAYKVNIEGYYAGGVTGSVRDNAPDIFLNGFTVYVNISNGSYVGGITSHFVGRGYVVKNSKVYGSIKGTLATGGVTGYVEGSVTIGLNAENANRVYATVGGTENSNIGGIVGTAANSKILYNIVEGKVFGQENVGGIAGIITSSYVSYNKVNTSSVSGGKNIGGIVGYVKEPLEDASGSSKVDNNECNVDVSCTISEAGGIIGYVDQINTQVLDNTSTKLVKGPNNIGGIVGASSLPETRENDTVVILKNNHKKNGNVEASTGNAGGIIGYMASGVTNANIVGESAVIKVTGNVAGGIVGRMTVSIGRGEYSNETSNLVEDTLSNRDHVIQGKEAAGGIVGHADCGGKILDVIVKAKLIQASDGAAGGVVGYASKIDVNQIKEIKFGDVTAKTFAGGIIGQANGAKVPQQSFVGNYFGNINGKDAAVYAGNATKVTLEGKEDKFITLSAGAPKAIHSDGSIGAIFGYADSCSIKYVKSTINVKGADSSAMGGLIGMMNNSEISYCEATGKTQDSATSIGGLVGEITGTSRNSVNNSKFAGDSISSSGLNVGGIAGASSRADFENNSVTAALIISCNNGGAAGGVVGKITGGSIKAEKVVPMKVTKVNASGGSAGGIVGYGSGISISGYAINITGVSGKNAGGVVGEIKNASDDSGIGDITFGSQFTVSGSGDSSLGGVVGKADGGYKRITISEMKVPVTEVTGESSKGSSGGIVGKAINVSVASCSFSVDSIYLKGNDCGGIFGNADNSTIASTTVCSVGAEGGDNAGGIYGKGVNINSFAYNESPINVSLSAKNVGAVAGTLKGRLSLSKLNLKGSVSGKNYIGGVVGQASQLSITACDVASMKITATKGIAYGSICGEAEGCSISSMRVKSSLSCSGVTNAGAAVGSQIGGTLSISVEPTFKFNGSTCTNVGAFVGSSTGNVTVSTEGKVFHITVNSSSASSAGGFVGMLSNGATLTCPPAITAVYVNGGSTVGGIAGTCSNANIRGGYTLYWKLSGSTTAGEHGAGDDRLANTEATYYIHKYGGGVNNPLSYATAVSNQKGSASSFMSGSTWGSSYCLYPGEKLTFNDAITNMVVLTDAESTLSYMENPAKSEVAALSRSGPVYLKEINNNKIRLQGAINECPEVNYWFSDWDHHWKCVKNTSKDSLGLNTACDNNNLSTSGDYKELAIRVASDILWAFANGDKNSTDDYAREYKNYKPSDIAYSMQQCYGIKIENGDTWSGLKASLKSEISGFSNDITLETMQKWTAFYRYTKCKYVDSVFKKGNDHLLYNISHSLGENKAGFATESNRLALQNTINRGIQEHYNKDKSYLIDNTSGGISSGGMKAWYRKGPGVDFVDTIDELYKKDPFTETDDEVHKKEMKSYTIQLGVYVDTGWDPLNFSSYGSWDNPEYDLDIYIKLWCEYHYNVKAALSDDHPSVTFQEEIVEVTDTE